jgi:hypothetical protein
VVEYSVSHFPSFSQSQRTSNEDTGSSLSLLPEASKLKVVNVYPLLGAIVKEAVGDVFEEDAGSSPQEKKHKHDDSNNKHNKLFIINTSCGQYKYEGK